LSRPEALTAKDSNLIGWRRAATALEFERSPGQLGKELAIIHGIL
jgi:hypothetical protein